MVAISPCGLVTFLSPLWGGRISDHEVTAQSELLQGGMLEDGDSVMADRSFDVEDLLAAKGVRMNIPAHLKGRAQLSRKDVEKTRRIAEIRIHVERAIGRVRNYDILNNSLPLSLAPIADDVVHVCFFLTNFDKPLVQY